MLSARINNMIKEICQIPLKLEMENKSPYDLLKESGYFENSNVLTVEHIEEYLNKNKDIIMEWLNYSSDQRTPSGWYFIEENKTPIVGYLNNGKREQEKEYSDLTQACAIFIFKEIESIKTI